MINASNKILHEELTLCQAWIKSMQDAGIHICCNSYRKVGEIGLVVSTYSWEGENWAYEVRISAYPTEADIVALDMGIFPQGRNNKYQY